MNRRFSGHLYKWTNPWGSHHHHWELRGPDGGIHFAVSFYKEGEEPSCGLEFHHARSSGYGRGEAPHHLNCPVIGEPCWHDGTSLYARESIWPRVEPMLRAGDHSGIFRLLEFEYDRRFRELAEEQHPETER